MAIIHPFDHLEGGCTDASDMCPICVKVGVGSDDDRVWCIIFESPPSDDLWVQRQTEPSWIIVHRQGVGMASQDSGPSTPEPDPPFDDLSPGNRADRTGNVNMLASGV